MVGAFGTTLGANFPPMLQQGSSLRAESFLSPRRHIGLQPETALYGRLSLLDELFPSHFVISMVSDGSVSECHESVPSTPSCLTRGTSAAKVGKVFA